MSEQAGYSADQHAAAWASYYAQQGYTPDQILASTGYDVNTGTYVGASSSSGANAMSGPSAYDANAAYAGASAQAIGAGAGSDLLASSSIYDPNAPAKPVKDKAPTGKRETVVRKGNGKMWEDPTLIDWDPKWFRIFVGDLSNDVSERTLDQAFGHFASYVKSKVVRDRLSLKAKYGFVAFKDPEDFLKAWKTMDGKYVGQRPIRLMKVREDKYGGIETKTLSARKAKQMDKVKKNHGRPLDGRPTPY